MQAAKQGRAKVDHWEKIPAPKMRKFKQKPLDADQGHVHGAGDRGLANIETDSTNFATQAPPSTLTMCIDIPLEDSKQETPKLQHRQVSEG